MHHGVAHFHDAILRIAVTRAKLVNPRFGHGAFTPCHPHATIGIGSGPHATEFIRLDGFDGLELAVIHLGIVVPLISGDLHLSEFHTPSLATAIDLTNAYHVGLTGHDVDLHRLFGVSRRLKVGIVNEQQSAQA